MGWGFQATALCLLTAGIPLCASGFREEGQAPQMLPFPERLGFLESGPKNLRLVGAVTRVRNGFPFYTLAYYVDLAELKAAAGPGRRSLVELAQVLQQSRVAQGYLTRFEQKVSRERRVEFLLENLQLYWDGPGFRADSPGMRSFLPFFETGLERGEVTQVWIRNGVIYTRKSPQRPNRTADPALCRAFVNSYLGDLRKPGANRILREELLKDLPALLEAETARPRPSAR